MPVDLGRVFSVSGGLPLAKRAPQRQAYRMMELKRWREFLGMPLNLQPKGFPCDAALSSRLIIAARQARSEEHTSELQSLMRISYAVFCLQKKSSKHYNRAVTPS